MAILRLILHEPILAVDHFEQYYRQHNSTSHTRDNQRTVYRRLHKQKRVVLRSTARGLSLLNAQRLGFVV